MVPGKTIKGMGGAMDLVSSGSKVIVTMEHTNKDGGLKIVNECSYPLTGLKCCSMIITELAVFEFIDNELVLTDIAEGSSLEEIRQKTECQFKVAENLKRFWSMINL